MKNEPGSIPARHFTVQTLAKHWEVSPSHIYNLIHTGTIRYLRIGKAIRIPVIFVTEYEEKSCQEIATLTSFGSTQTESGTSLGQSREKIVPYRVASRQKQQIEKLLNNSEPNSSQD